MSKLIFCTLIFISSISLAQKSIPAFGKIDKLDLELTDCNFDNGASAIKLIDWGKLYYERGTLGFSAFKTVFEKRVRIKILKAEGLGYANVTIPFYNYNNEEKIIKLEAYAYNLDAAGNITKTEVGKSSIYTKKINKFFGEIIIAFPEARVGSVIEYKYKMERETMGHIKDWYFQDEIPTQYSEYQINIPQVFRFNIKSSVIDDIDVNEEVVKENLSMSNGVYETEVLKKKFIMKNLVGIRNEPYMGAKKDYLQRIEFQLSQLDYGNGDLRDVRVKWENVVSDLYKDEDFGKQLNVNVFEAESIVSNAKNISSIKDRVVYLYNYIRTHISWNEEESIYAYQGISKTWKTNKGNTADINLLFVKLLKDANVKADPILFSTRDNGIVNIAYPFIDQLNIVMAYVDIDDKKYVIDATDKYTPYNVTPEKIVNTQGFITEQPTGKWIDVVEQNSKYKSQTIINGIIDNDGILKGKCVVLSSGYARNQRLKNWIEDRPTFKQKYFSFASGNINVEDLVVNNIDSSRLPLEQKASYSYTLNSSGNYKYFTPNFFTGLDKNPFTQSERFTDIDFGVLQEYLIYGNFNLSTTYKFDELPQNISMVMPDKSIVFNRFYSVEDNNLNIKITIEFKRTYYTPAMYLEFKEFYKKMLEALNEQIAIKK